MIFMTSINRIYCLVFIVRFRQEAKNPFPPPESCPWTNFNSEFTNFTSILPHPTASRSDSNYDFMLYISSKDHIKLTIAASK